MKDSISPKKDADMIMGGAQLKPDEMIVPKHTSTLINPGALNFDSLAGKLEEHIDAEDE